MQDKSDSAEEKLKVLNEQLIEREKELEALNRQLAAGNHQLARSEKALGESEKRYRQLVETMSEGLIVMDLNAEITYANPTFCKMLLRDHDGLVGRRFVDFVSDADAESVADLFSRGTGTGAESCEVELVGFEGRAVAVLLSPQPVLDDEGERLGSFAIVTDIRRQKEAEREMREARDFLENIFRTTQDAILVTDASGYIVRANIAVERMLGYRTEELLGKNTLDLIPQGEGYRTKGTSFAADLFDQGYLENFETFFQKKNGSICPIECNITLLREEGGSAYAAVSVLRDISERKRMEQHMIQSEKLSSIGELASGVAHDFNNVLSAILGRAQLLLGTLNCSGQMSESTRVYESIKKDLEIIEKAALDGAETIRRIMEFARTDSDVSHFEVVDLNAIVRDALEFTRPRWKEGAQARGVLIQVETELEELPALLGNASELREVLINIVINAIDALPQGGQIRVRSYLDEPEVVVDISDSGDGIEQAIMDKIFDPFFTTKGPQATGLGMSVSYGIIKRHKGSVSVASKEGQATTFSIRLPVTEVRPQPDVLPAAGVKTGKARILVVEDEEEVCILLADILNAGGHAVVAVLDGREAIELIKKEQFDMVITDLAMPGISGWQVAAEVKKCCPATPVVLVTGWSMHAEQDNENRRNVDLIVNKPFTVEKIMVTVREALCIKENTV